MSKGACTATRTTASPAEFDRQSSAKMREGLQWFKHDPAKVQKRVASGVQRGPCIAAHFSAILGLVAVLDAFHWSVGFANGPNPFSLFVAWQKPG